MNKQCQYLNDVAFAAGVSLKDRNAAVNRTANDTKSLTKQEPMTSNLSLKTHGRGIRDEMM